MPLHFLLSATGDIRTISEDVAARTYGIDSKRGRTFRKGNSGSPCGAIPHDCLNQLTGPRLCP
jgi:hypothetical protein